MQIQIVGSDNDNVFESGNLPEYAQESSTTSFSNQPSLTSESLSQIKTPIAYEKTAYNINQPQTGFHLTLDEDEQR